VDSDEKLIEEYVATFPRYDDDFAEDPSGDPLKETVVKFATPEAELAALEAELPLPFPPLFRALLLNYRYDAVDLNGYSLLANPWGIDFNDLKKNLFCDEHLWPVLLKNGFVQLGKGEKFSDYDPVCFDASAKMAVVKLDHEEILMHERIEVVRKLAASFRELVEQTIAEAPKQ